MTFPEVLVYINFSAAPDVAASFHLDDAVLGVLGTSTLGEGDTWSDVSVYLKGQITISRGSRRVDTPVLRYEAGTANIVLKNADRRFDPTNLSGPYVSGGITQVEPMRKLWIRVNWAGTVYDLFQGFIDAWGISYFEPDWSEVAVTATDAFTVFGNYDRLAVGAAGSGENSGARVNRILDSINFPAADRLVATGDSTLQATTLEGDGLAELFLVADSELGELYVDGTGQVTFRNRHAMLLEDRSNTSQVTFGDGGGTELSYADLGISYDWSTIANLAQVAIVGGTVQTAEDAASRSQYLTHTFNRSDLLLETDAEAADYAGWIVGQSATPELRFDTITVQPRRDETVLFPQVLGRRFGDRITIIRRPPGGGSAISRDVIIRGVTHEITTGLAWRTVWTLQSAAKYAYLVLDDAILGVLDTDRLAF